MRTEIQSSPLPKRPKDASEKNADGCADEEGFEAGHGISGVMEVKAFGLVASGHSSPLGGMRREVNAHRVAASRYTPGRLGWRSRTPPDPVTHRPLPASLFAAGW
jgi:hypothetical protein